MDKALDKLAGGSNSNLLAAIKRREEAPTREAKYRQEEYTKNKQWTTSAEVKARQRAQAAPPPSSGMTKK